MSELGPVSQAILDYINSKPGYIENFKMIYEVSKKTGESHSSKWYFRQLVALALKGRIDAKVTRTGDKAVIRFRRLQEAEDPEETLEEKLEREGDEKAQEELGIPDDELERAIKEDKP